MRADTRTNVILKTDDVFETPACAPEMRVCVRAENAPV